ncbi:trypsin-like peptidase domain-containing protein [Kitasatospora sp. NPDC093550]|uniref:trypsin-like peptidase domain-containing protein n=1 Tax=Kitasatospora sp. NPDC093550 TaxID=3364089 RepID=UPI00382F7E37
MGAASWARTVQVLGSGGGCGSGTLIAPGLVLTALHVVSQLDGGQALPDGRIRVRVLRDRQEHPVEVVWAGDRELDAVLLRVDPRQLGRDLAPVRWGELTSPSPDGRPECSAVGFPQAMRQTAARPDGSLAVVHDCRQVVGHVSALTGLHASKYDLEVCGAVPAQTGGGNGWSGLSGAGLFCHEILIGVMTGVSKVWQGRTLWALPVRRLLALDDFTSVVTEHTGNSPQLESADQSPLLHEPPVPRLSPSYLLSPQAEVVPFTGMDDEIAALTSWCTSSRGVDVAVVFGPGGVGKTRLATELIRRMTRRRSPWTAGFLADVQRSASSLETLKTNLRPLLLVLDYAETRVDQLEHVLRLFDGARHAFDKVRILLLARPASRWWRDLEMEWRGSLVMEQGTEVLLTPATTHRRDDAERDFDIATRAFRQRIAHLAALTGPPAEQGESDETEPPQAPDHREQAGETAQAIISIHMTALAQALENADLPPTPGAVRPVDVLLAHESRYWKHSARSHGLEALFSTQRDLLRQLVAVQRITGAEERRDALNAVMATLRFHDRDFGTPEPPNREQVRRIDQMLTDLYPATDGAHWGTMSPDVLAAELITQADRDSDSELVARILPDPGLSAAQQHRALTVLARASTHQPALTKSVARAVATAADALLGPAVDAVTALPPTDAVPWLTALRSAATCQKRAGRPEVTDQLGRIDDLLDQLAPDVPELDTGAASAPELTPGASPAPAAEGRSPVVGPAADGHSPPPDQPQAASAPRRNDWSDLAITLPAVARPHVPEPVSARFHFRSGAFADLDRQRRLDRALHALTEQARRSGDALPAINTIFLGLDGSIELNLATAARAVAPFHSADRDVVWHCSSDHAVLPDADNACRHAYPALVHLGWRLDGSIALADLEQVRLIHLDGAHATVQAVLGELAFELETRPHDSGPHVHVSGIPEDLHFSARSTSHETLEAALDAMRTHTDRVRYELRKLGLTHPRDARLHDPSNDLWRPRAVLTAQQPGTATARDLGSILDARPLGCLGVVARAPSPGGGPAATWTVAIDASANAL